MATRTRQTLTLLIPALLLAACATRGPAPASPPGSSLTSAPTATTASAAPSAPDESTPAPQRPQPTISCPSGTHLRAGECLINPSIATT